MDRPRLLDTPYGESTLTPHPAFVRIEAPEPLAADWTLGWWHGRAAGEEALFARSFWKGELGSTRPSPARTETDAFAARWSFQADLALETARQPAGDRNRVAAYCQGFNQAHRPGSREPAWAPSDCHLLARTLGFLEWWETRAPQISFLLEALEAGLGWDKVLDLWPSLGPEPNRSAWAGLSLGPVFSPEAQALAHRLRRFRPGTVWTVPGHHSASGRPLLAANWVSDVTEPGLPFLPVRIDTSAGSVRGLTRPGHPGFLAGKTGSLAWAAAPALDDTIDLRILDRNGVRTLAGAWAGTGRTGTLQSLLELEGAAGVDQARERTLPLGSACLDLAAVDVRGGHGRWALGPRWLRTAPRDAWLPAPWGSEVRVGPRPQPDSPPAGPPGRHDCAGLQDWITRPHPPDLDALMAPLRFLLPDTEEGQGLRRWAGLPGAGPEAQGFDRLQAAVLACFWESSPLVPPPDSAVFQALLPAVDRLVQAPHSAWFPSADKNRRLAEAVRQAFGPVRGPVGSTLGRRAVKALWTERQGGKGRIYAATTAVVAQAGEPGWWVFHTDDETETPQFTLW